MTDSRRRTTRFAAGALTAGVLWALALAATGVDGPSGLLHAAGFPSSVNPFHGGQELPEGVTAAMVEEGRELYLDLGNCATCHGEEGEGGIMGPPLVDREFRYIDGSYPSLIRIITEGIAEPVDYMLPMRPRGGEELTDEQVAAVAAYAWVLTRPGTEP